MSKDYGGIINDLVRGEWREPGTGKQYQIPPDNIVIKSSLDGIEAELVAQLHPTGSLMIVSDPYTYEAMGRRLANALKAQGRSVSEFVWQKPMCSETGVEEIKQKTRGADHLIAVGSGTINDTVKYASYLDGRSYSVFATSPMNAYTTNTASVSFDGFKRSITCHGAKGIFFDLSVLSKCPSRLIAAAFSDVICRTTAQVDWLLSHILFDTAYAETPYTLLAQDEKLMIDSAAKIAANDIESLGMLTRISAIMGLGTCFTKTTHSGSMGEHMISHYIDMFADDLHPGSSHGEQVGVATITMSRLQNQILSNTSPPVLHESVIPRDEINAHFAPKSAKILIEQTTNKAISTKQAARINARLETKWSEISERLKQVMLPFDVLQSAMFSVGCQTTPEALNLDRAFYREAVYRARHIRDRYTMLDFAADSAELKTFVDQHV